MSVTFPNTVSLVYIFKKKIIFHFDDMSAVDLAALKKTHHELNRMFTLWGPGLKC